MVISAEGRGTVTSERCERETHRCTHIRSVRTSLPVRCRSRSRDPERIRTFLTWRTSRESTDSLPQGRSTRRECRASRDATRWKNLLYDKDIVVDRRRWLYRTDVDSDEDHSMLLREYRRDYVRNERERRSLSWNYAIEQ